MLSTWPGKTPTLVLILAESLLLLHPQKSCYDAAVAFVQDQYKIKKEVPKFKAGDNVTVNYKILRVTKNVSRDLGVIKRQRCRPVGDIYGQKDF